MPKQLTVSVDLDDVVVLPVSVPLDKISIGDVWVPPSDLPEFHSRIFEADTLPPNWIVSPETLDAITVQSKDFAVSIDELFQSSLSNGNCRVTQDSCLHLSDIPTQINSVDALAELLKRINSAKLCQGNPGEFVQLAHKGSFFNQSG